MGDEYTTHTVTTLNTITLVPRHAPTDLNSMGMVEEGRNTSPCTSFQPDSSLASSITFGSLYWAMSLRRARSRIIEIITVRNSTIMIELVWRTSAHGHPENSPSGTNPSARAT